MGRAGVGLSSLYIYVGNVACYYMGCVGENALNKKGEQKMWITL
jgi:hypothetical protein